MKAYIFDLDGTLIDSYNGILESIMNVLDFYNINIKREDAYSYIIENSVHEFLNDLSKKYNISLNDVKEKYSYYRIKTQLDVSLMPFAKEMLDGLYNNKNKLFIYTHKGNITYKILEILGIDKYFTEIVTSENKFKLKPNPEGILYILNKYNIKKEDAIYIGDRKLDIDCAINSNIRGILYKNKESKINYSYPDFVSNLIDLLN